MKVFISKANDDCQWLHSFCKEKKWSLVSESLIEFSAIDFKVPKQAEVIFFSSKNGVRYFLEESKLPAGIQTACIGRETAKIMKKNGIIPDFIGENSGDPVSVGKEFLAFVGEKNVFFPTSNQTLHTVANQLPENQKTVASIYETNSVSKKIDACDWYIFSSPSNVKSYLLENKIPSKAKVIAWGNVTAHFLFDHTISVEYILETSQKEELIDYLTQQFSTK
ncbi:MAG: uroporphyrinogen-III synthase [Crocinitomicaceae bacterium]